MASCSPFIFITAIIFLWENFPLDFGWGGLGCSWCSTLSQKCSVGLRSGLGPLKFFHFNLVKPFIQSWAVCGSSLGKVHTWVMRRRLHNHRPRSVCFKLHQGCNYSMTKSHLLLHYTDQPDTPLTDFLGHRDVETLTKLSKKKPIAKLSSNATVVSSSRLAASDSQNFGQCLTDLPAFKFH